MLRRSGVKPLYSYQKSRDRMSFLPLHSIALFIAGLGCLMGRLNAPLKGVVAFMIVSVALLLIGQLSTPDTSGRYPAAVLCFVSGGMLYTVIRDRLKRN
jgi:membrane-bound ClpP family serine protease